MPEPNHPGAIGLGKYTGPYVGGPYDGRHVVANTPTILTFLCEMRSTPMVNIDNPQVPQVEVSTGQKAYHFYALFKDKECVRGLWVYEDLTAEAALNKLLLHYKPKGDDAKPTQEART